MRQDWMGGQSLSFRASLRFGGMRSIGGAIATATLLAPILIVGMRPGSAQPTRPDRPDFFEEGQQQLEEEVRRLEQPDTMPTLTVESEQTQWNPVLVREGGFAVWMPQGVISQRTRTVETAQGAIAFDILSSNTRLGRFVVAFSDPLDLSSEEPQALLERVQDRISGWQTGFGLQNEAPVTFADSPGKEFTLANSDETIYFRVLLINERLYVLALSQSNRQLSVDTKTSFFNSFQLL